MLAGLNRILDEWLCDSLAELIEEMGLWKWNDATKDFWSRLAEVLQQSNISVSSLTLRLSLSLCLSLSLSLSLY